MIAKGRGRRSWVAADVEDAVVHDTLHGRPDDGSTHWTTRTMAARHGIGKDTVARIWRKHDLKPWRIDTFKVSNDPDFEAKLVDVVGLYLDPPARAVVFSYRREDPGPGVGSHPAVPAYETGPGRHHDP